MILVYEFPAKDKAKLAALLESDPYGEKSFSRNGYKIKEGASVGLEAEKCYLYVKCTDEFALFAREKLKGNADECKPDAASKVAQAIEDEESSAEQGFGSIFG
jgi:hypothetical protein